MRTRGVLAVFVKTPGLSPVKTRLAAKIGEKTALEFYNLALDATAALARQAKSELSNWELIWAVAEEQGLISNRWREFGTVFQGSGGLGQRLHNVYDSLLRQYGCVAFMGADSPQIFSSKLVEALSRTAERRDQSFILGKTLDGGFYFFGGGISLPRNIWSDVEYSSSWTAQQLETNLRRVAPVESIDTSFDIDTIEDLQFLKKCNGNLMPEQINLINWVNTLD